MTGFTVIEKYSQALIECECGEVFCLAEYKPAECCPGCGCLFLIHTQIVKLPEESEIEVDQELIYQNS